MKKIVFLTFTLSFFACTEKKEHPRFYHCNDIKLRQHDLSTGAHRLIVDNYSEECLDDILGGELIKKYLDTVKPRDISMAFTYILRIRIFRKTESIKTFQR